MQVFTGAVPFNGSSTVVAMLAIQQGDRPLRPAHATFTEELWMMMQRCWDRDPHLRPEVSEALKCLLDKSVSRPLRRSCVCQSDYFLACSTSPAWKWLTNDSLSKEERLRLETYISAVSNNGYSFPTPWLIPLSQIPSSQLNGVCIPQRKYGQGAGHGAPNHQNLVPFIRQDGTYLPVTAALRGDYIGLVGRDAPGLYEAGYTITIRLEVSRSPALCEIIEPIVRTVAWVCITSQSGELFDVVLPR